MNDSSFADEPVAASMDAGGRRDGWASARWTILIVGLIGLGLVLRLLELTSHSLWFDEGLTLQTATPENLAAFFGNLVNMGPGQVTQPLYFFLLHLWIGVFGDGDASLRLMSVLLGSAAVAVIAISARQAFGRRHSAWATAFAATSAFAVYYSQEIRPYALLMLLTALLLWAYLRVLMADRLTTGGIAGLAAATVLALTGSFIFVFFLTALALSDLLVTRRLRRWFLTWLVPALVSLPLLAGFLAFWPATASVAGPPNPLLNLFYVPFGLIAGQTFGPPLDTLRDGNPLAVVLTLWPQLALLAAAAGLVLLQLLRLAFGGAGLRRDGELSEAALAAGPVLGVTIILSFIIGAAMVLVLGFNWLPRRAFYLLGPIALVLPLATIGRRRWLAAAPLLALIVVNVWSINNYFFDETHRRDEYRASLAYIADNIPADIPTVMLEGQMEVIRHYGHDSVISGRPAVGSADFKGTLAELIGDAPQFTLFVAREWDLNNTFARNNDRRFLEVLGDDWVLEDQQSFVAVNIYSFKAR